MAAASMVQQVQFHNKLLLLFSVVAMSCSTVVEKPNAPALLLAKTEKGLFMQNGLVVYKEQPFNGTLYSLHDQTTDTAELCSYVNGKEHGEWKGYYPSGKLKEKRWFTNGNKEGELIAWWENGTKRLQYSFASGEYEGTCSEWNEAGKLVKRMNYKKGYEEGLQQCWYDNGKIKANYIIRNGRRYGLLGTKNCMNVSDSILKM